MSLFHPTQAPAIADARSPEQGRSARASLTTRASLAAVAAALVLATLVLPLWQAQLVAPQYPDNLHLIAYGSHVTGDVEEIDLLNHYVGMRAFDPADVPEMALWPLVVGAGVLAAIVAVLAPRRLLRRLALAYLWLTPLGILAVIQLRLHQYGHDIDPAAALRIPDFTPWVLGPTRVMNFTTWSYPGLGLLALVAAGAVATFGPRAVGRLRAGPRSVTGALAVLLVLAAPSPAHAAHDHDDHSTHGSEEPALAPADGISQGPSVGPAGAPPPRPAPFDGQARHRRGRHPSTARLATSPPCLRRCNRAIACRWPQAAGEGRRPSMCLSSSTASAARLSRVTGPAASW